VRLLGSSPLVASVFACACASAPAPLPSTPIALHVAYAERRAVESRESSPQGVCVSLYALGTRLHGPSVDAAAAVIAARQGAPFRGVSGLPAGSAWLRDDAARAAIDALEHDALRALRLASVVAVPAADLLASARPDDLRLPCIDLQVGADGGVYVQIGAVRAIDGSPTLTAHVAEPLAAGATAVLFVPSADRAGVGHAIVLTPTTVDADAIARARAAAAPPPPSHAGWPRRWRIVFQSIGLHNRRPPLLEIARTLGAARCRDALLVADEALLIAFTERLAAELTPADADAPWPFERTLWRALLPRLERDELPDALHAHCLRQLGAMADDTAALRSALDASADGDAFARALRADNVGALADHDAAWRARGRDWLRRQGVEVPGFDPLGDDAARRDALRAFHAVEAAAEGAR
jgi:hypothetical protein